MDKGLFLNISDEQIEQTLNKLEERLQSNNFMDLDLEWSLLKNSFLRNSDQLKSVAYMEATGGEPYILKYDKGSKEIIFADFCKESPKARKPLLRRIS